MLILCIGPDTFRAHRRAMELEKAFREKHDPAGSSVERIWPGKTAVDEVIERVNTVSLFSPRRFLRTSDLLSDCPKAKLAALVQALNRDAEHVIVVDVESEPLSSAVMSTIAGGEKIIKYEYPLQEGTGFRTWVEQIAKELGVSDEKSVRRLAETADGDPWLVWNELLKLKAGGQSDVASPLPEGSPYDAADAWLRGQSELLSGKSDAGAELISVFLNQARAALRVRDGAIEGIHPFVVKKLKNNKISEPEAHLARALLSLFAQRNGLAAEDEPATLL